MRIGALPLALALGSSCCSHVVVSGSKGVSVTKKRTRRTNNRVHGSDYTEDIEFWTRMTQQMGSLSMTDRPTPRPTPRTPDVTPFPTEPRPVITPSPVSPSPTYNDVTPSPTPGPITPEPTSEEPTQSPIGACGLTPEDRAEQMRQLALTVTDESVLNDSSSAQAKALDWLINEDGLQLCPSDDGPCEAVQRYLMASFYYAAGGGNWNQCNAPEEFTPAQIVQANAACERIVTAFPVSNPRIGDESTNAWLTPVDECEWGGVACWGTNDNRNGCMDQIDFEQDGLSGSLIPEMHNLSELRFFILEQGSIAGQIPSDYGLFEKLLIFDLDFNDLTGPIPDELFNMDMLQQLDLNDNNLSGPLSTNIGNLKTLTFLQLDHNELSGNIPSEMGELKNLRIGFFNDNDLTGVMPPEVCANRNITSPPGLLGTLVTDCSPPNPEVDCPCCSSCNVPN